VTRIKIQKIGKDNSVEPATDLADDPDGKNKTKHCEKKTT